MISAFQPKQTRAWIARTTANIDRCDSVRGLIPLSQGCGTCGRVAI